MLCVLGTCDHSTQIYEENGPRKWDQKMPPSPPPNKEHPRGLGSAEGSLGDEGGGAGDIGQQI